MAARLGGFLMNAAIDPWLGAHNRAEFGQGTGSATAANSTMHSLPLWATWTCPGCVDTPRSTKVR